MFGFLKPIAKRLASWLLEHGKEELEKAVAAEVERRAGAGSTHPESQPLR